MVQKQRILITATEQFMTYGVRTVSMDDIATTLGISKKTLYKYYKSKDDIVYEVTKSLVQSGEMACEASCKQATSAIDELFKIVQFIQTFFNNMNASALYDIQKYYPKSYEIFQQHQKGFIHDSLVDNLNRGKNEGYYRKSLDIEITARLRMAQIKSTFDQEFFPSQEFDFKKIQLASLELYIMAICTEKGRKYVKKHRNDYGI